MTTLAERIRTSTPDQWPALNRELALALEWKHEWWPGHEGYWRDGTWHSLIPTFLNDRHDISAHIAECLRRRWEIRDMYISEAVCVAEIHILAIDPRDNAVCRASQLGSNITLAFAETLALAVGEE